MTAWQQPSLPLPSHGLDQALDYLLEDEGGWSDNKNDHGGQTFWGVTQATYDQYRKGQGLPTQPVLRLTKPEARDLYQKMYWNAAGCDKLPWPLSYITFDASVNSGPSRSVKWLQAGLNLPQDGVVGPKTILAAQQAVQSDIHKVCLGTLDSRVAFLAHDVQANPSQAVFLLGWWRRTMRVLSRALT